MSDEAQLTAGRAVFIVPYFGRWPWYWQLWADSVRRNPGFDFLLVTDLPPPPDLPPNVTVIAQSLSEVLGRLSRIFDISVTSATPHKLCDFRPFFGLAFADLISGYDYWGYCDVDLIFGNLEPLNKAVQARSHDILSPWECTAGHCTLIRNVPRCNEIALSIPRWRERIYDTKSTHMDEGAVAETAISLGNYTFLVAHHVPTEWSQPKPFLGATVTPGGRLAGADSQRPFLVHIKEDGIHVMDDKGDPHEVLYFHFMAMKEPRFWKLPPSDAPYLPCSVTPYGYTAGLLPLDIIHSLTFRLRCWLAHFPHHAHVLLRSILPTSAVMRVARMYKSFSR